MGMRSTGPQKFRWLRNQDFEFAVPFPLIREGPPLQTFTNSYVNPTYLKKKHRKVAAFSEGKCQFNFGGVFRVSS